MSYQYTWLFRFFPKYESLEKTIGNCIFISLIASIVIMIAWPLLTQEKMVFVSLLTVWVMGAVITSLVYFRGKWRGKIPTFEKRAD